MLPVSALQAIQLLRGLRPSCIVSVGGYAAGPVAALGGLLGISTVLLEQNSVPGMTNRLLDRVASHAFLSFDRSASHFKHAECHIVGTPVRDDILELRNQYTYECSNEGPFRVLVLGGSGGAGSLNERLPETLTELQSGERGLRVRHQCGRGRKTPVEDAYRSFSGELEIVEFIDDMPAAYRDADLLICRAGASTISEILTVGLPAVFVPFPEAADDHQTKNARAVAEAGAGIELADKDLGTGRATRLLQGLINNPVSLRNIAERARRIGKPDAAENIAEIIGRRILKPKAIV
jgi:UDP-N-acetylglucosamine--N-acetylmuramyl-(pentapeptide) pyrophosphoryl-undecaprenol N-acetylglucosamine transferase